MCVCVGGGGGGREGSDVCVEEGREGCVCGKGEGGEWCVHSVGKVLNKQSNCLSGHS